MIGIANSGQLSISDTNPRLHTRTCGTDSGRNLALQQSMSILNSRGQVSVTEFTSSDPNPQAGLLFTPPSQVTRLLFPGGVHGEVRGIQLLGLASFGFVAGFPTLLKHAAKAGAPPRLTNAVSRRAVLLRLVIMSEMTR